MNKIFFLHGWSGSSRSWDLNIPFFNKFGFSCYPLPMEGRELPEPPKNWGVPEFAEATLKRIQDVLESGEQCVLVGHSFGGRQAMYIAAKYPTIVNKLILTNAAGIRLNSVRPSRARGQISALFKFIEKKAGKNPLFSYLREVNASIYGSKDYKAASPIMREVMKKVVDFDLQPYLPLIKAETLIVWGELDMATPIEQAKVINENIRESSLIIFPGCGHRVHIEVADRWNQSVLDFLKA